MQRKFFKVLAVAVSICPLWFNETHMYIVVADFLDNEKRTVEQSTMDHDSWSRGNGMDIAGWRGKKRKAIPNRRVQPDVHKHTRPT